MQSLRLVFCKYVGGVNRVPFPTTRIVQAAKGELFESNMHTSCSEYYVSD